MEELYNLGISENTLKCMIEVNPEISELSKNEILERKLLLELMGCSEAQILNIISSNPMYLSMTKGEIVKLVNYLSQLGFESLNVLFDANPYIFNLEPFEIEKYIKKMIDSGKSITDIIDQLDSNPSIFLEI